MAQAAFMQRCEPIFKLNSSPPIITSTTPNNYINPSKLENQRKFTNFNKNKKKAELIKRSPEEKYEKVVGNSADLKFKVTLGEV